ncbi:hypothetical protein CYMTET_28585, partial [Cymbomonas tetramitiformis]
MTEAQSPADDRLKVAVRLRPLSPEEAKGNREQICFMEGKDIFLKDPSSGAISKYTYDHCFDSSQPPSSQEYASQVAVHQQLGMNLMDHLIKGYHCALFTYGQTGSGKSYSMMGTKTDVGLIPRILADLYARLGAIEASKEGYSFQVQLSMLEVMHNERLRDLLVPRAPAVRNMKFGRDPEIGTYVQGFTRKSVENVEELMKWVAAGDAERTVAATTMNRSSNRTHTVLQVVIRQVFQNPTYEGAPGEQRASQTGGLVSVLNLVDLAGSERSDRTSSLEGSPTGNKQRMQEGNAVNKSLAILALCIQRLAENSEPLEDRVSGGRVKSDRTRHVPYRDSLLTRLLQDCLAGKAHAIMLATVSPADVDFRESLSTLKYAQRGMAVRVNPKTNFMAISRRRSAPISVLHALQVSAHSTHSPPNQRAAANGMQDGSETMLRVNTNRVKQMPRERPLTNPRTCSEEVEFCKAMSIEVSPQQQVGSTQMDCHVCTMETPIHATMGVPVDPASFAIHRDVNRSPSGEVVERMMLKTCMEGPASPSASLEAARATHMDLQGPSAEGLRSP